MEFEEVLKSRRSIRKFSDTDLSGDLIKSLIECAVMAPSSMNGQPWHFIVVRKGEIKKKLAEIKDKHCPPEKREYPAGFLIEAPVVVITCVDRTKAYDRGIESAVLATGNLLLAAANRGLSGVYMSAYKSGAPEVADDIRAILGLPVDIDPITIVPLGYPQVPAATKEIKSAGEVIHYEAFGRQ